MGPSLPYHLLIHKGLTHEDLGKHASEVVLRLPTQFETDFAVGDQLIERSRGILRERVAFFRSINAKATHIPGVM